MYLQHFCGNDSKASSPLKSANSVYYQKTCTSIFHLDVILNIFADKNLNQKTAFDADTFSCNKSFKWSLALICPGFYFSEASKAGEAG